MKIILIIMFLCSVAYAEDIQLTSDFTVKKPTILKDKLLDKNEQKQVEDALKNQGRRLIHTELKPLKNDYQNDFDRGTVEYTTACRNYSYHKVIIPDGTVIQESNFSQKEPHSPSIQGNNLTFIDCNLVNVEVDPTWILKGCNNCQIKRVKKDEKDLGNGQKQITISHQVEDSKGNFNEVQEDVETTNDADSYSLAILRLNK